MGNSSVTVKTRQTTRDLLAQFAGNQRLIKLFENLAQDVGTTIPAAMDQLQESSDSVRALAVLVQAIAAEALDLAIQAVDAPIPLLQAAEADDAPPAQPVVVESIAVLGYYITGDPADPSTTLGYGVWVLVPGRFLVGYASGDADFGAVGGTGGVKTITIEDHPDHEHNVTSNVTAGTTAVQSGAGTTVVNSIANGTATSTGVNAPNAPLVHLDPVSGTNFFKTLPPFLVVYIWQRTA